MIEVIAEDVTSDDRLWNGKKFEKIIRIHKHKFPRENGQPVYLTIHCGGSHATFQKRDLVTIEDREFTTSNDIMPTGLPAFSKGEKNDRSKR